MSDKFLNVPVDEDTEILFQAEVKLGDYDVLYQKWYWDGITAESIIFADDDVEGMRDDEIEAEVRSSPIVEANSEITFKRSASGFIFVNFNFTTFDDEETYTEPEPLTPEEREERMKKFLKWVGEHNREQIELKRK